MTDILGTHDDVQDPMRHRSLDSTNGIDNVDHQRSTRNSPEDCKTMKDDGYGGDGAGIISKGKPTRLSNGDVDRSKTDKAENERHKQNGHMPSQEENGNSAEPETKRGSKEKILKLTREQIHELTSSPDSLPLAASAIDARITLDLAQDVRGSLRGRKPSQPSQPSETQPNSAKPHRRGSQETPSRTQQHRDRWDRMNVFATPASTGETNCDISERKQSGVESFPSLSRRSSSKVSLQHNNTTSSRRNSKSTPKPLHLEGVRLGPSHAINQDMPSPMPQTIPIPPYSLPTYLQLELSSHKPSPLYIHRSITSDFPYESSRVKIERLQNFLKVPPKLEGALWFGFFACLDAWLFSFTILPLRFIKAVVMVVQSIARNVWSELKFIGLSLYYGPARLWQRRRASSATSPTRPSFPNIALPTPQNSLSQNPSPKSPRFSFPTENDSSQADHARPDPPRKRRKDQRKHRRAKSMPSELGPCNKADIVTGFLILISCVILMQFDASRMYHGIRGQAAIKLYVIYNVLEVCDRLFSALGQDILECLISKETLERRLDGRSKIWRPFWLFILALLYNLVHSTALFYQVITLNVAVNSYSNALLTLLMSNQFVEIKSTVFKKFEKENLFQLTCADIVERFQLWLMLTIIALRNLVETGGLSLNFSTNSANSPSSPPTLPSILPKVFTMFPDWTGYLVHLLPFLIVLGSEMLVDWLKHCYITKFNNTKPAIYSRFHDILAKDYYSNAFADQNLTRRLGLPVIPLSCLFIRASVQTYHMFVATYLPPPIASTATSLVSSVNASTSPTTTAALHHIDHILRHALGRSTFGTASSSSSSSPHNPPPFSLLRPTTTWLSLQSWSSDDIIALLTMTSFFLVLFLALLACKLLLGMCLLSYARHRYRGMKRRERESVHAEGRRVGGWGVVEVDEDKRRCIYEGDPEGGRRAREREQMARDRQGGGNGVGGGDFEKVQRYSMVGKRIW